MIKKIINRLVLIPLGDEARSVFSAYRKTTSVEEVELSMHKSMQKISSNIDALEQGVKNHKVATSSMPPMVPLGSSLPSEEKVRHLHGGFFRLGGIHLLFSIKAQGKTALSMQIGMATAKGEVLHFFTSHNQPSISEPQNVIYLDYEMVQSQIDERYPGVKLDNFFWVGKCVSPKAGDAISLVSKSIKKLPNDKDVFLVIDNLSMIGNGFSQPADAKFLIQQLQQIQAEQRQKHHREITVLLVAHTNKETQPGSGIKDGDLAGAQDLMIPADCVFSLGPSRLGSGTKILKIHHSRNVQEPETIALIKHIDSPYHQFQIIGEMVEEEALSSKKTPKKGSKTPNEPKYPKLYKSEVDDIKQKLSDINSETGKRFTQKELAEKYGIPESYVGRYIKGDMEALPNP